MKHPCMQASASGIAAGLVLLASPAAAQRVTQGMAAPTSPDSAWFAVTIGADTLALELVVRERGRVDGVLRLLKPQPMSLQYTAWVRPSGTVDSLHTAQGAANLIEASVHFADDSAFMTLRAANLRAPRVDRIRTGPGALPFINLSSGMLDVIFRRARHVGGTDVAIPLVAGPQTLAGRVRFVGADSAVLDLNAELRAGLAPDGGLLGAVVPSQSVRFTRIARPATWARAAGPTLRRYLAPPGAPYSATDVTVRAPGGVALAGTLTLPSWASSSRPAPVVITISGSGPQNRDSELLGITGYALFRQVADTLGRRGVGVLRLDDRGVGESQRGATEPTSADFADDVRAAVAWLRARPDVDAARIGLLGHSEGGIIAPMVASDDSLVGAVALLAAPSRPGHEVSAHQRRLAIAADTAVPASVRDTVFAAVQARSDSLVRSGTDAWLRYWWSYDPHPAARRVRAPVLILHGATDTQVPPAQGAELASIIASSGNRDVSLHTVPKVNHLFLPDASGHWTGYADLPSKVVPPAIMGILADWFAARLAPRAGR